MNAKVVYDTTENATDCDRTGSIPRFGMWGFAAGASFCGSAVCFVVAMLLSLLAALGILDVAEPAARITLGSLLMAFVLAFLGAHALDRRDAQDRGNQSKSV